MRTRASGFTIIEMMIVMSILALLAAIAAPNLGQMLRIQRVKNASFDIFSTLNFARSEAIKRNVTITIAPVGGGWSSGWKVTDANANLLREESPLGNGVTLNGPATVVFTGSGRLSGGVMPQFVLEGQDVPAAQQRCIKVDLSGRAVSYTGACP